MAMNYWSNSIRTVFIIAGLALATSSGAQVVYTDSFNSSINYLTNGTAGTVWDGVYFGAGEFNNTGLGGGGLGQTLRVTPMFPQRIR